jgi:hypothetical protein
MNAMDIPDSELAELTPEEAAELTPLNAAAFDLLRMDTHCCLARRTTT